MRYSEIQKQIMDLQLKLDELLAESRKDNFENKGSYHRKYSQEELESDVLRRSEEEAMPDVSEHYTIVATRTGKFLEYTEKTDEHGNAIKDENGETVKERKEVERTYSISNFNQWSTPIHEMDEEERLTIQKKALMNIHSNEEKLGYRDLRTRVVNGEMKFVPEYSEEESKKRFKFTRTNEVDGNVPLCKFYINDKLIYTMNVEQAVITNPLLAFQDRYRDINDEEQMNDVERLCHEIWKNTSIRVLPEEIPNYLDSGYLINGDLEKHPFYRDDQSSI